VSTVPLPDEALSRAAARRVDEACDQFEKAWRSGGQPRLEDALAGVAEPERGPLFRELLAVELELRRGRGERPSAADYLSRFPEQAEVIGRLLETGPAPGPIFSNYEILAELGRGGMGIVYLARQSRPERIVALKVVRTEQLRSLPAEAAARWIERFRRETAAAAHLEHDHLVPVYESGEQDGQLFYSMRYIEGRGLHEIVRAGPLASRAAAELLEPVARAAHYAHQQGILHRDLKPHNILIETRTGRPFVLDFGLAKRFGSEPGASTPGDALTGTEELLGTPFYMAPEQISAPSKVGIATDVYGLGATLYHVLTGRPPFQAASVAATVHQVVQEEPVAPRRLNPSVEPALETIVLKCLSKEPQRRYASAEALADDLGRYRRGEPILARPTGRMERGRLWCRRNPGKALLLAGLTLALLGLAAAASWGYVENRAWAEAQEQAARESDSRAQDQQREALLQSLQALLHDGERSAGWSDRAWQLVRQTAALGRDERLRDLAGLSLAGLDAHSESGLAQVMKERASGLAFEEGGRMLLGGTADPQGKPGAPARLWDGKASQLIRSKQDGEGPVAFRSADHRPIQVVVRSGPWLLVWEVAANRPLSECRFTARAGKSRVLAVARDDLRQPLVVLSADGSTVAAAAVGGSGEAGLVGVWETKTGRQLLEFPGTVSALALSARGGLLALSDRGGTVTVWSVPGGECLATFQGPRVRSHCLTFNADASRLALGDAGGTVTIWDMAQRMPCGFCRGSSYDVYAVAFSPDGTLLAAGGRGSVRLYEAATSRCLLRLGAGDYVAHLAFSPDGRRLAASSAASNVSVTIWRLEEGRGLRTLRGLSSQVARVWLSPDGKRLAALAHDWQVAVWDLEGDRLLRVVPVAPGATADNADLAFSPDGRRLAFSAGEEACLWELETGRELGRWTLPFGLIDRLAFQRKGPLLLCRMERGGEPGPGEDRDFHKHPRLYRARRLIVPDRLEDLFTIKRFNERIYTAVLTRDGGTLIVEGRHTDAKGSWRAVTAFDGLAGTQRWSLASAKQAASGIMLLDPTESIVLVDHSTKLDHFELLELSSGRALQSLRPQQPHALGPQASYYVLFGPSPHFQGFAYSLMVPGQQGPALSLGGDLPQGFTLTIAPDGRRWAWGSTTGTVTVADLDAIRARLDRVGLR
jgi:WD40 repeat protein/predicted Ser/Thr protein kinase